MQPLLLLMVERKRQSDFISVRMRRRWPVQYQSITVNTTIDDDCSGPPPPPAAPVVVPSRIDEMDYLMVCCRGNREHGSPILNWRITCVDVDNDGVLDVYLQRLYGQLTDGLAAMRWRGMVRDVATNRGVVVNMDMLVCVVLCCTRGDLAFTANFVRSLVTLLVGHRRREWNSTWWTVRFHEVMTEAKRSDTQLRREVMHLGQMLMGCLNWPQWCVHVASGRINLLSYAR